MELTSTQQILIACLKHFGVVEDDVVGILVFLQKNDAEMWNLIQYMADNKPTSREIVNKAGEIIEKTFPEE